MKALPLATIVAATLLASAAIAQTAAPSKKPAARPAAPAQKLMTRDELRSCMDEKDTLRAGDRQHNQDMTAHEANVRRMHDLAKEIGEMRQTLNKSDKEQVAKVDAKIDEYNSQTGLINAKGAELKANEDKRLDAWDRYNDRCSGRPVDQADVDAVQKERKAAGK